MPVSNPGGRSGDRRGGYNSGIGTPPTTCICSTECGINRVALRSTLTPGAIMLRARRPPLPAATVPIVSHPVEIQGGLESASDD